MLIYLYAAFWLSLARFFDFLMRRDMNAWKRGSRGHMSRWRKCNEWCKKQAIRKLLLVARSVPNVNLL